MDRKGLFGLVCDHVVLHMAVMIQRGEHWRYATMLLQKLAEDRALPVAVNYDIGCEYQKQFFRWLRTQANTLHPNVIAAAQQLLFPLPPFHAQMH